MYFQVAHGVQSFNTVGTGRAVTTGGVRVAAEVVCCVLIRQTGQTQVDFVHARHGFQSAVDVTNTNFEATGAREEANAVDACAGWASCGQTVVSCTEDAVCAFCYGDVFVSVVLLDTCTCTECNAHVGLSSCVDLQTETACYVGFIGTRCVFLVKNTKTAVAAECNVCSCNASGRNQSCCSEENFFHELSLGLNSYAHTGESGKGMRGVFSVCPSFGKDRGSLGIIGKNCDAAMSQLRTPAGCTG